MQEESALQEFLNPKELEFIKQQVWWTGCKNTPYLIKGGVFNDSYLIMATNLKSMWVQKADKDQILLEMKKYNPALAD